MGATTGNTFGTLSSAPDNATITTIYRYFSSVLSTFKAKNHENENAITNRLCIALMAKKPAEYPFFFHHQNLESDKENTSTDFAVFGSYAYAGEGDVENADASSLIKFEAKRLNSTLPKNREKEYVCGEYAGGKCLKNSGGIERFKNGRHGQDVTNAAIVGYLQTDSPVYWLKKVNEWIKEQIASPSDAKLIWSTKDGLNLNLQAGRISDYSSLSYRLLGDEIRLRHFWIDISA